MSHPVHLRVYGSPINRYLRWLGFSFCLSSVEVHGMEYVFRPHDRAGEMDRAGVIPGGASFQIQCLKHQNKIDSILIGHIELDVGDVFGYVAELQNVYTAASYHPITNNSHHFADHFCRDLTSNPIPPWLNSVAVLGCCCRCLFDKERNPEKSLAAPNVFPDYGKGEDDSEGSAGGLNGNGGS